MAFNLKKVKQNFFNLKQNLPKQIQNEALRYFVRNFDAQRWDGTPWVPRVDRTNARRILVRRGQLRRALAGSKREATFQIIRFSIFVQSKGGYNYAEIHNEGGTISKKEGRRTLNFRDVSTNVQTGVVSRRFASTNRGRRYMRATSSLNVTVGAHTITIPRRRFLGESRELDKILNNLVETKVNNCFK